MLWIILWSPFSSGKANRILIFILMLLVLATSTSALPILFPTINITRSFCTFSPPCAVPFAFVLSSPAVWLMFPLRWVISTVYTKLLSACTSHMAFVQLHTPLRCTACFFVCFVCRWQRRGLERPAAAVRKSNGQEFCFNKPGLWSHLCAQPSTWRDLLVYASKVSMLSHRTPQVQLMMHMLCWRSTILSTAVVHRATSAMGKAGAVNEKKWLQPKSVRTSTTLCTFPGCSLWCGMGIPQ